jgi:hypothetical protein
MAVSVPGSASAAGLNPQIETPPARADEPAEATRRTPWRRRLLALYPIPLALFPGLSLVSSTAGAYSLDDLAIVVGAVTVLTLAAIAVCVAAVRLLRRDEPLARGAFIALLVVAWIFYYVPAQNALSGVLGPLARSTIFGPAYLAVTGTLLALALRRRWRFGGVDRFLALAGSLVVLSAAARAASANLGGRERVERSAMWRALRAPIPVDTAIAAAAVKRDVYLIVLDGYPNAEVLRTRFGFDNRPFLDSLRALGFTIPRRVRSNYVSTILSMSSLLNFEHDTLLARDVPPNSVDNTIASTLIRENRAARVFKELGYRYVMYPTEWFEPTRSSPFADYVYPGPAERSLLAELQRSELRRAVFGSTLLAKFSAFRGSYGGRYILDEFRQLREVATRPEPTFTFAHFMLPHQPILLDAACRPINESRVMIGERLGMPGPRDAFLGAVECGNRQMLSLLRDLLGRSSTPPIVIVLGDHGSLSRGWAVDAKLPTDSIAAERLAPLGAFYLPEGGAALVADSVTHVNVFRHVLRHYFGAQLPLASNEAFFNQAGEAYLFRPVDERAVIGGP